MPTGEEPDASIADASVASEGDDGATVEGSAAATNDVAGVQDEPDPTATPDFTAAQHYGSIQETIIDIGVAQTLHNVSVHVTPVAVYPIDYFVCILGETGGAEADALAAALEGEVPKGATHAVVADPWLTNSGLDFAQINVNSAGFTAAGGPLTSHPIAVLGSTTEVLITAGQGRGLTLVSTATSTVGVNTGPITLTLEPPLVGGEERPGKYQLFLPTP